MPPDLTGAAQYALTRLSSELSPLLCYHDITHTRDDVVVHATWLGERAGISGLRLLLLQTAAYYHDIGFVIRRAGHEEASVLIAAAVLPGFGYRERHIRAIAALIRATRLPQRPRSLAAQVLADADLAVLGREDFLERNGALRREIANFGAPSSDETWYAGQLAFLQRHRYWTTAAHQMLEAAKQHNGARLAALLAAARAV